MIVILILSLKEILTNNWLLAIAYPTGSKLRKASRRELARPRNRLLPSYTNYTKLTLNTKIVSYHLTLLNKYSKLTSQQG